MFAVSAKPLEWKEQDGAGAELELYEPKMGFWINGDPSEEDPDYRYTAGWGEGDSESFATLDEAKQWCQDQANAFIRDNAQVEAVAV